jgi:2-amino-4-hydroxy-6-hydroxymethyldihydropteridine diphosphokinase
VTGLAVTAVYIAAGSNVDPLINLPIALASLRTHYPSMRISPAYQNKAVGFAGDDFINLAVGFETDDSLSQVIAHLHEAEAACGRPRDAAKWAPRTMDLDLLLYGDEVRNESGLKLPRPDLVKRPYMLKPIAELAPELRHPVLGKTMRSLWADFDSDGHQMIAINL